MATLSSVGATETAGYRPLWSESEMAPIGSGFECLIPNWWHHPECSVAFSGLGRPGWQKWVAYLTMPSPISHPLHLMRPPHSQLRSVFPPVID